MYSPFLHHVQFFKITLECVYQMNVNTYIAIVYYVHVNSINRKRQKGSCLCVKENRRVSMDESEIKGGNMRNPKNPRTSRFWFICLYNVERTV